MWSIIGMSIATTVLFIMFLLSRRTIKILLRKIAVLERDRVRVELLSRLYLELCMSHKKELKIPDYKSSDEKYDMLIVDYVKNHLLEHIDISLETGQKFETETTYEYTVKVKPDTIKNLSKFLDF